MSIPDHIKRVSPFLLLGRYINKYHSALSPEPFEDKATKVDPTKLKGQIDSETLKLRGVVAVDPEMDPLRKVLGIEKGTFPDTEILQMLCYILFRDYCCNQGEQNSDSITFRMGALFGGAGDGFVEGRMLARSHLAVMLEQGICVINDTTINLCGPIMQWVVGGNTLMMCNLNEQAVHQYIVKREQEAAQAAYAAQVIQAAQAASADPSQPSSIPLKSANGLNSANSLTRFVAKIPVLTPMEMDALILKEGYVGQKSARLIMCLSAYRHIQRLRRIYVDGIDPRTLPQRENILCLGPTGCGKTFLMTTLFQRVLKIPAVTVDITKFTETGYVGGEVEDILTRLLLLAEMDVGIAQIGMVCIDEIDKLAGHARSRNYYSGGGTTKDVSGLGVQKGLLKLLEGSVVDTPVEIGNYRSRRVSFDTSKTLFVGCGAFSGLEVIEAKKKSIGFGREMGAASTTDLIEKGDSHVTVTPAPATSDIPDIPDSPDNPDIASLADALFSYGLMMELLGRFHQFVRFDDLSREQLRQIIEATTVEGYRRELLLEGIDLDIDPSVFDLLVDRAHERKTGARGLATGLIGSLSSAMFSAYSTTGVNRRIRLFNEGGNIQWDIGLKNVKPVKPVKTVKKGKA